MRRRLPLSIALAILCACLVAGTAAGQGGVVGVGESGVEIDIPNGENLDQLEVLPQCSNLADDDGDGIKDMGDPDCSNPLDSSESGSSGLPTEPPAPAPPTGGNGGNGGGGATGGNGGDTSGGNGGGGGTIKPGGGGGFDAAAGSGGRGTSTDPKPNGSGNGANDSGGIAADDGREPMEDPPDRRPDGAPTNANPGLTIADFGPAPIGVPNFVIDQFSIPPFLLPIYQACGTQYGIPWQVLASINRIETAFGTNLNVSSAGALGWMQFIPSSWEAYGVDANDDGRKDPYNPVDAICAAARYLKAAGGETDLRTAIFAYNHADWYVDEVLLYADQYSKLPDDLIGSLTGLTEGARFPVAAKSRYADDISERQALKLAKPGKRAEPGNAAAVVSSSPTRRGIDIFSREDAPVVAVNDGVITEVGKSKQLGNYIVLRDAYGNRFTYAQLGEVATAYPVPEPKKLRARDFELVTPRADAEQPNAPASAGSNERRPADEVTAEVTPEPANTEDSRERLYAFPERESNVSRAGMTGQLDSLLDRSFLEFESFESDFSGTLRYNRKTMELRPLGEGSKVVAGTILGRVGEVDDLAPRLHFQIQPAGRGAPRIDPKPILDGWKLLEATAIYRAAGQNPLTDGASTGQVLLMSKSQLIRRVLTDPRIEIYSCGREDIRAGQIDRRILATLAYLAEGGLRPTVTSLLCGRETSITTSGNVSQHSFGGAVDIAQLNGLPLLGNQGRGSVGEAAVRQLMELQGAMEPDQIISLMDFGANTFAMGDHADHIHVGFAPMPGEGPGVSKRFEQLLKPDQWERLIDRIGEIDNPRVPTAPSEYALPAGDRDGAKAAGKRGSKRSRASAGE